MDYNTPIDSAGFSVRTFNAIKRGHPGVNTLGELRQAMTNEEATRNLGRNSLSEINEALAAISKTETVDNTAVFDYSVLDADTADFLHKATTKIANSYADIGAVLAEAQERLANNKNGVFEKWCTSLGMPKRTAYRFIQIHEYRKTMLISCQNGTISGNELEIFDNLPKTLQADISSPSAPAEAVNAVLSGDITTHKDFIAMKKQLEETQEENERLTEKNRFLSMDYTHEKERNERMLDELKEFREKNDALEVELKQAQSEAREVIVTDLEQTSVKELQRKIKELTTDVEDLTIENDRLEKENQSLTFDNTNLEEERDDLIRQNNELMTRQPIVTGGIVTGGYDPEQLKEFFEDYYEAAYKAVRAVYIFVREDYPQEIKNYVRNRVNDLRNYIEDLEDIHEDDF